MQFGTDLVDAIATLAFRLLRGLSPRFHMGTMDTDAAHGSALVNCGFGPLELFGVPSWVCFASDSRNPLRRRQLRKSIGHGRATQG